MKTIRTSLTILYPNGFDYVMLGRIVGGEVVKAEMMSDFPRQNAEHSNWEPTWENCDDWQDDTT